MRLLRDAFRSLRANPIVTTAAILSLALGIGANTAIFSILNSLILRTLPVDNPASLAMLSTGDSAYRSWTNPIWEQVRDRAEHFEGAMAWWATDFDLAQGGQSELVGGIMASGSFFRVLGVPAVLGRTFNETDDQRGGGIDGPVAVISYSFWQRRFGGSADVINQALSVQGHLFTIIGVTPPGFTGADIGRAFDVAIPIGTEAVLRGEQSWLDRRSTWWLRIMLRLKPEQSLQSAATAINGLKPQIREATLPDNWRPEHLDNYLEEPFVLTEASNGVSRLRSRYSEPLMAIFVVVILVLAVACTNIANLLLARSAARRQELSLRLALGASRWQISRSLLAESLVLSIAGAAAGLLVAFWGSRLLVQQLSARRGGVFLDLSMDWRVLFFTAGVAVLTALVFGIVPALRSASIPPGEVLQEGGRGVAGDRHTRLRSALVIGQVALTLVLVIAAGLFTRTFAALANLDLGFERSGVLIANVDASRSSTPMDQLNGLYERILNRATNLPAVSSAATSVLTPVSGSVWNTVIEVVDGPTLTEDDRTVNMNYLSPGWFQTYRTTIIAGRDFDEKDRENAPAVAIVNQAFVRQFRTGENPLGRIIKEEGPPGTESSGYEIVGLVEDAVYRSLREEVPPTMYLPAAQRLRNRTRIDLSLRSAGPPPSTLIRSVVEAIGQEDPNLSIVFGTLEEQVDESLTQERILALLSGFFGLLALLLSAIGLYGVTAYGVSRRRLEMGIRMALGASSGGVIALVLRKIGLLILAGVVAGGLVAFWVARYAEALLFQAPPNDPASFATAALLLLLVGIAAGFLPARRASRIDPAQVLRDS